MVNRLAAIVACALTGFMIGGTMVLGEVGTREDITATVLKYHNGYFQLRENHNFDAAYALLSSKQKENMSRQELETIWTTIRNRFGRLTSLDNKKVTIFVNPDGQPPGRYATIKFRASFEQPLVFCGSIIWAVDQGYRVHRERINLIEIKNRNPLSAQELEEAYLQLGC